jgi:hypothetical protein
MHVHEAGSEERERQRSPWPPHRPEPIRNAQGQIMSAVEAVE